jgi:hypothetical protein
MATDKIEIKALTTDGRVVAVGRDDVLPVTWTLTDCNDDRLVLYEDELDTILSLVAEMRASRGKEVMTEREYKLSVTVSEERCRAGYRCARCRERVASRSVTVISSTVIDGAEGPVLTASSQAWCEMCTDYFLGVVGRQMKQWGQGRQA